MKKLLALLLTLLMVISFVGCSTQAKEETLETKEVTTSSEEATDKQDNYYPISFNNYNYAKEEIEQTVNKAPERVVVVYQNSIETLLALGLGDKIVGAAGLDHEIKPELADDFANLNYYEEGISKEEIMGLNPDMIVSWSSFISDKKLGEVDFWHDRDVNTFIMSNSCV
jgi:iron complex transport system substrate-binding protein